MAEEGREPQQREASELPVGEGLSTDRARRRSIERLAALLRGLQALTGGLAAARTPEELAEILVREGQAVLEASAALFFRRACDRLELVVERGAPPGEPRRIDLEDPAPAAAAVRTRNPVWIERREGVLVVLPLIGRDAVLGAVEYRFPKTRAFVDDERGLLMTFAAQAAQAMDRADLYVREIDARQRVEALGALGKALAVAATVEAVTTAVVEQAIATLHASACTVHIADDDDPAVLVLAAERGLSPPRRERLSRVPVQPGDAIARTLSGEWSVVADAEAAHWSGPLIAEGRPFGLLGIEYAVARTFTPADVDFFETFARQCAEAILRARRFDAEREARALAEAWRASQRREEARRAFLVDAMATLAESLDYEVTLAKVARLAVPQLADWVGIDIVEEGDDGAKRPRRVATAHADPERIALAADIARRYPSDPRSATGVPNILRTGQAELHATITDAMLVAGCVDEEHLRLVRDLGLESAIVVPLVARGNTLGAMSLVYAKSGRRYDREDLEFAEEIGRRCAMAIDNARLYASEQTARKHADVANRAKDEFLAVVSHELRTPLNAILGWAKMMSMPDFDGARRERAVETIERNAVAMAQLIDDLLDMSRIISGKMRLEVQAVELPRVLELAVESLQPTADARAVTIARDVDASVPSFLGDPTRLQQIVWNLLSNAIKFTPRGGKVTLGLRFVNRAVEIRVTDTGKGIDPAFLPNVFDAFRQEDASYTRSRGGLGLGLAITRQLVELHAGRIRAESEGEGRGATFVVHLPLSGGARLAVPEPPSRSPSVRGIVRPPQLRGLKVLVVDDEPDARFLIRTILEDCGCVVVEAGGVDEALELLASERPGVLVSDIAMPERDGLELIQLVRALPPEQRGDIPAAALTAYARAEDRRRLLNAGYSMHIPKPVERDEIVSVIASLTRFSVRGR